MKRRLQFICVDNVNAQDTMLLAWDNGTFWLFGKQGTPNKLHNYGVMSKDEWYERGWRTVIEL
jgi:hypothetical protein